jgi:hypothetical protein
MELKSAKQKGRFSLKGAGSYISRMACPSSRAHGFREPMAFTEGKVFSISGVFRNE